MTKSYSPFIAGLAFAAIYFAGCSDNKPAESTTTTTAAEKPSFGGYESQVKWGEHEYCKLFRSSTIQLEGQCQFHQPNYNRKRHPFGFTQLMGQAFTGN